MQDYTPADDLTAADANLVSFLAVSASVVHFQMRYCGEIIDIRLAGLLMVDVFNIGMCLEKSLERQPPQKLWFHFELLIHLLIVIFKTLFHALRQKNWPFTDR